MKLTKLQNNRQIYYNLYAIVHNKVWSICQGEEDSNHLLVTRFNQIQVDPWKFEENLLELFYSRGASFGANYIRMTATDFWNDLESEEEKELFNKEFVEFLSFFEEE